MPDDTTRDAANDSLEQLRQLHRADKPDKQRTAELLRRIGPASPQRAPVVGASRGPASRASGRPSRPIRAALWFGVAALSFALGLWVKELRWGEQPPLASEPPESTPRAIHTFADSVTGCVIGLGAPGLLADFERQTPEMLPLDGRRGQWVHLRSVSTGEQVVPVEILKQPDATEQNRFALRAVGPAPTGWGVKVTASLAQHRCYDASRYAGVQFRARGSQPVFVVFQTVDSVPPHFGGRCVDKCWYSAGRIVPLEKEFQTFRVLFDELHSPRPQGDVEKELMFLEFTIQSGPEPYEFWLDDVSLIEKR